MYLEKSILYMNASLQHCLPIMKTAGSFKVGLGRGGKGVFLDAVHPKQTASGPSPFQAAV